MQIHIFKIVIIVIVKYIIIYITVRKRRTLVENRVTF